MSTPTFVVGTGRCGSTMLSNMLREHPKVLSLSEFFTMVTDGELTQEPFSQELMDGAGFCAIIVAAPRYFTFMLRHGLHFDELLYPTGNPAARFSSQAGVPAILLTTLPHLTDEHDALFDRICAEVVTWPAARIGDHYMRLFAWIAEHFGKQQWVERSGALLWVDQLAAIFPDARFVHIVRDGRDVALSMREHNAYRIGLAWHRIADCLGVHPLTSPDRTHVDRVPEDLKPFLPERFDAEPFREFRISLPDCGAYWSYQLESGLKILGELRSDRLLTLRYEDFCIDPKLQLDTLCAFLGEEFVDEDWPARCAATVRPPRSSWRDLPKEEARALTEACRPGFDLLSEAGLEYEF